MAKWFRSEPMSYIVGIIIIIMFFCPAVGWCHGRWLVCVGEGAELECVYVLQMNDLYGPTNSRIASIFS